MHQQSHLKLVTTFKLQSTSNILHNLNTGAYKNVKGKPCRHRIGLGSQGKNNATLILIK
jgi:hypothetical protein